MKSKKLISSIIVITITIALVIMFTSGSDTIDQTKTASAVEDANPTESKTDAEQKDTAKIAQLSKETQNNRADKPVHRHKKSSPTSRKVNKPESASVNRITRVSRPGQKYRMVRVDTTSIPPKSELRKWSRSQWVTKVSTLQADGDDSLAQDYITAYNTQYPNKDLNNYLK